MHFSNWVQRNFKPFLEINEGKVQEQVCEHFHKISFNLHPLYNLLLHYHQSNFKNFEQLWTIMAIMNKIINKN